MDEALPIASASGFDLDRDVVRARALEICHALHTATSSTQQDIARGRPTEARPRAAFETTIYDLNERKIQLRR